MSIVSVLCRPSDRSLNRSLNRNADGTAGGIERRYVTLRSIGMSLFTKKEEPAQENVESKAAQPTSGKGRPTPKRKDAQAQNLRPLVPKDRDASRKAAKARISRPQTGAATVASRMGANQRCMPPCKALYCTGCQCARCGAWFTAAPSTMKHAWRRRR